jgi:transglutaminase-like putative cysteine protease
MDRRSFITASTVLPIAAALPHSVHAETRTYSPAPGRWRTFEVTTRLEIADAGAGTRAWVPVPSVDSEWQQSLESTWSGNLREATLQADPVYGAKMVSARWSDGEKSPLIEIVSRIRTRDRGIDWAQKRKVEPDALELALNLEATDLIPTDGIVAETAAKIVAGKKTDVERTRAIYDWIVTHTYREQTVRGCGIGNIKAMLETGNMGGKCADLNALFVGLCRASRIPARDVYGIRVAKSAFGYKELGAGSSDISKAQHCRAEVWLEQYGWVAMDPADVAKVMRLETKEWFRDPHNDVTEPVYRALFGAWEGNWMGYNDAHDVVLPGASGPKLAFLMYPQGETRRQRIDSLDPETFKYRITVREITA